jgi:DNA-binding response OmpR family regulator
MSTIHTLKSFGDFSLNAEMRLLQWQNEEPMRLSCKENGILFLLSDNFGSVIMRQRILDSLWKDESVYASRSLDIFICSLRKKLKKDPTIILETIRGDGFILYEDKEGLGYFPLR